MAILLCVLIQWLTKNKTHLLAICLLDFHIIIIFFKTNTENQLPFKKNLTFLTCYTLQIHPRTSMRFMLVHRLHFNCDS